MKALQPINSCALVELGKQHTNFTTAESKHDTRTNGVVISVAKDAGADAKALVGKTVFFEEYQEGARISRDDRLFCFIKLDDIRGYEDEQAN